MSARMQRLSMLRTACRAQASSLTVVSPTHVPSSLNLPAALCVGFSLGLAAGGFSAGPLQTHGSPQVAAQAVMGEVRDQQKGVLLAASHRSTFAPSRPVTQPVTSLFFRWAATLNDHLEGLQREFPLLSRLEGPAVVPDALMRLARTYRDACRLAWALRRVRNMTYRQLAAEAGLRHQHVTDYFHRDDKRSRRSLPGEAIFATEAVLGNTAISQFHARRARLTVLEEMQAQAQQRKAA